MQVVKKIEYLAIRKSKVKGEWNDEAKDGNANTKNDR